MIFRFLIICLFVFLSTATVFAQEAASVRQVPIITFRQQVDCITEIQRHPRILKAQFSQQGDIVDGELIIANDQSRIQAKEFAHEFIRLIKKKSLDDNPSEKNLGKGLYTYKIKVSRANKAVLATGIKRFDGKTIEWAINEDGEQNAAILADETPQ